MARRGERHADDLERQRAWRKEVQKFRAYREQKRGAKPPHSFGGVRVAVFVRDVRCHRLGVEAGSTDGFEDRGHRGRRGIDGEGAGAQAKIESSHA